MALKVSGTRKFNFKPNSGKEVLSLDDPNPLMTPEDVMEFYSNHYPELLNGNVTGPELGENDEIVYSFSFTAKQKG